MCEDLCKKLMSTVKRSSPVSSPLVVSLNDLVSAPLWSSSSAGSPSSTVLLLAGHGTPTAGLLSWAVSTLLVVPRSTSLPVPPLLLSPCTSASDEATVLSDSPTSRTIPLSLLSGPFSSGSVGSASTVVPLSQPT